MRDFLIDTQTISYWYNTSCPQHAAVIGNIAQLRQLSVQLTTKPKLLISVITLGEIEFGHRVSLSPDPNAQEAYRRFVHEQLPVVAELTADADTAYGELRTRLFDKYAPGELRKPGMLPEQLVDQATALSLGIQENDLWICAQAVAHGFVLVTNDRMKRIREVATNLDPPLVTQNWTVANSVSIPD